MAQRKIIIREVIPWNIVAIKIIEDTVKTTEETMKKEDGQKRDILMTEVIGVALLIVTEA